MAATSAEFIVVSAAGALECVVKAEGEIDLQTAPRLRDVLSAILRDAPATIVIDLAGVGFIDSTGLGVLIDASKQGRDAGTTVLLLSPVVRVRRILELTGAERMLTVSPEPAEA